MRWSAPRQGTSSQPCASQASGLYCCTAALCCSAVLLHWVVLKTYCIGVASWYGHVGLCRHQFCQCSMWEILGGRVWQWQGVVWLAWLQCRWVCCGVGCGVLWVTATVPKTGSAAVSAALSVATCQQRSAAHRTVHFLYCDGNMVHTNGMVTWCTLMGWYGACRQLYRGLHLQGSCPVGVWWLENWREVRHDRINADLLTVAVTRNSTGVMV